MPTSKSENKIRVTRLFGADDTLGLMDPAANMHVRHGQDSRWIVSLTTGNFLVNLSQASGGTVTSQAYPHWLLIDDPQASGFGWPTSSGSVVFGHHTGFFASGVPGIPGLSGSGMAYTGGDSLVHTFSRVPND